MPIAKIFIVEDEAITALDIKNKLEKLNYEVVGIKNRGEDALKLINKTNPDIILMDIILKGELDGIETARLINIQRKIPVIYLTAHYDDDTIERSKSTNPYGFLLKPLNDRDLNSCIRMALFRFETENKLSESEENLRKTNKMNSILFSSLPGLTFIINSKGIITETNNKSNELNLSTEYFLNNDVRKLFHGKTGSKFFHLTQQVLESGTEQNLEHIIKVNEHKYTYNTKFIKYTDESVLAIFTEKTKGIEYEKALKESEAKYKNLVKNTPFSITRLIVKTNKYEFVNDEFVKQSGYTLKEFNDLSNEEYQHMIHPDDRDELINGYSKWISSGCKGVKNLVYRIKNKNKEVIWLDSYHFADIAPDGSIAAVNQIYLNINKQKNYEDILSESKQYLDAFFQQSLDGIFIAKIDPPVKWIKNKNNNELLEKIIKNTRVTRANGPLAEQFGMTIEDVLKTSAEGYFKNTIKEAKQRWIKFLNEGHSHISEYYPRPDGSKVFIEGDYYCLYDNQSNFIGYLGIQRDMTERKSSDEKIRLSEEKFRAVAESMPAQVVIFQDNKFVYANPYSEKITGYKTDEILKKNFWDLIHDDYMDIAKERGQKRLLGEMVPDNYEMKIYTKSKEQKWLSYSARVIDFNGKKAVLGIAVDITESKKNQDKIRLSEEKYRNFVKQSSEGIFRMEFNRPVSIKLAADEQVQLIKESVFIAECNDVFARMYDEKPEDILGKNINYLKYQNRDVPSRILKFIMSDYNVIDDEVSEFDPEGRERNFVVNISGVIEDDLLTSIWGVQRNITEKKKTDESIKRSLKEKDILLKEIHHRVKNNLQIVTSLLKLQSGYVKDEKIKQLFRESQNRVQSMSLIHQKLYQAKDLAHIDFKEYIETVTTHLQHSYGILEDRVKIRIDVTKMIMSIDNAIPAGLIINELVSNSLKHAFPEGRSGNIFISAAYDEFNNEYWLLIRDDGIGFTEKIDFENSTSFGLKLVDTLVKQLDGMIEIVFKGGSEFRIHFRSADYKERSNEN
ncbi:MAG: PAS domain S-box protein [Ignavibacteria bacterium]